MFSSRRASIAFNIVVTIAGLLHRPQPSATTSSSSASSSLFTAPILSVMQQSLSHPILSPPTGVGFPADDPTASSLFDWSDFLDFNLDEGLHASFSHAQSEQDQPGGVDPDNSGREKPGQVRKRNPRLVCSNFLAGRVPYACPELDAKLEEEERLLPGKKRNRVARPPGGPARCQVPGCEADISELKGYHRRHRVCLRCANGSSVFLDGESKRYCQRCGSMNSNLSSFF